MEETLTIYILLERTQTLESESQLYLTLAQSVLGALSTCTMQNRKQYCFQNMLAPKWNRQTELLCGPLGIRE